MSETPIFKALTDEYVRAGIELPWDSQWKRMKREVATHSYYSLQVMEPSAAFRIVNPA